MQERVRATTRIGGVEHPDTLIAINNLAQTIDDLGDRGAAQSLPSTVDGMASHLGAAHRALSAISNLAQSLKKSGDIRRSQSGAGAAGDTTARVRADAEYVNVMSNRQTHLRPAISAALSTVASSHGRGALALGRSIRDAGHAIMPTAGVQQPLEAQHVVDARTRLLGAEH